MHLEPIKATSHFLDIRSLLRRWWTTENRVVQWFFSEDKYPGIELSSSHIKDYIRSSSTVLSPVSDHVRCSYWKGIPNWASVWRETRAPNHPHNATSVGWEDISMLEHLQLCYNFADLLGIQFWDMFNPSEKSSFPRHLVSCFGCQVTHQRPALTRPRAPLYPGPVIDLESCIDL